MVDVPTDCPQRDERLGWTGDALARTASFNMDVAGFFSKWLTAYALALEFDLLPDDRRAEAARRLAAEVRSQPLCLRRHRRVDVSSRRGSRDGSRSPWPDTLSQDLLKRLDAELRAIGE